MLKKPILMSAILMAAATEALAQAQPPEPIWKSGPDSIVVTSCAPGGDHDDSCRAVELRRGDNIVPLGSEFQSATLLWSRHPGQTGPDALVRGDFGGSGGLADLFAVTVTPSLSIRKLSGERMDELVAQPGPGPLRLTLPFDIEMFNGAPHGGATIVRLPIQWSGGDFSVDLAALTHRALSQDELDFRALAVKAELDQWAQDVYPAPSLYPPKARSGTPVTVQALAELMLSGHADQARQLLHRAWPRSHERTNSPLGGEDGFWTALCQSVVGNASWKRFDLGRLPQADRIRTGAAGGSPPT